MMDGQSELRADRSVARIAKIGLRALDQTGLKPAHVVSTLGHIKEVFLRQLRIAAALVLDFVHEMTRVTGDAGNPGTHMRGMEKGILLLAAVVTKQAAFGVFLWTGPKRKDQLVRRSGLCFVTACRLLGFDVRLTCTVTRFTRQDNGVSGPQPRMRCLVVLGELGAMT